MAKNVKAKNAKRRVSLKDLPTLEKELTGKAMKKVKGSKMASMNMQIVKPLSTDQGIQSDRPRDPESASK